MSNGSKTYRPCTACGRPCTVSMVGNLNRWTCWGDCSDPVKLAQAEARAKLAGPQTAWERPCPRCDAEPLQPCRRDNGTLYTSTRNHHAERHTTPVGWRRP